MSISKSNGSIIKKHTYSTALARIGQKSTSAACSVLKSASTIPWRAHTLTFTGRIEAEDEVDLAFRISGRLLESKGKLGDRVQAGHVLATLENELNTLRQAQAGLAAAQGQLT